jgi:ABC-2 type transport system permease protein
MIRLLRSAYVIARRDFAATVLSKAFIFFLLGPLFPLLLGGVFGGIGARVATQTAQPVVAVVMSQAEFEALWQARHNLAEATGEGNLVKLVGYPRQGDNDAFVKRLLRSKDPPVRAVLTGWFGDPRLVGDVREGDETSRQIAYLLQRAVLPDSGLSPTLDVEPTTQTSGSLSRERAFTAQIGQMLLFFLTILLSGMVLSQLIEEKSNKIIEVVAAAVPIDALFIGKLFAMLAASVVGIVVWVSAGALLINILKQGGVATLPSPAVGWPVFLALGIVYFAMNYLLLGAVFLTIGAQASTVREVQTLSMPVTFAQVLIFGFASTAIGAPDSTAALVAAVFPLSSPMVMLARGAELPELWPHFVAFVWQAAWVALILRLGARMFRKTVLKSGPARPWWRFSRA